MRNQIILNFLKWVEIITQNFLFSPMQGCQVCKTKPAQWPIKILSHISKLKIWHSHTSYTPTVRFTVTIMHYAQNHYIEVIINTVCFHKAPNHCLLRTLHTESEIYDLLFCQSRPTKLLSVIKKNGSGLIFCIFTSEACILIGKDNKDGKKQTNAHKTHHLAQSLEEYNEKKYLNTSTSVKYNVCNMSNLRTL